MKRLAASSPSPARAWLRVLAAFALALFTGDHVLPALHYALVAHEMCPEHGQLEHAGNRVETHAHRDGGPAYTAASDDDHHDHCGSVPASPPRAPLAADATRVFDVARTVREALAVPSTAVLTADVVAFAPKQSPPGVVVRS